MTRYGPMFGPDVTFTGVAALRPRRTPPATPAPTS